MKNKILSFINLFIVLILSNEILAEEVGTDKAPVMQENQGQEVVVKSEQVQMPLESVEGSPVILATFLKGKVEDDSARFNLKCSADFIGTIPFLRGVAISSEKIKDKNVILTREKDAYLLIVKDKGRRDIVLEFLVPMEEVSGRKQIRFGLARSLISELEFEISGTDLDIDIKGAVGKTVKEEEGKTIVKANISNPEDIEVSWRPKPPSIEKMEAVIFAETVGVLRISGGVISQSSHIKLTPVQGMIEKIEFGLPEGFSLLGIKGENIKEWKEVEGEGERKEIIVELHGKEEKGYELLVEAQKRIGVLPEDITAGGFELKGVKQEKGYLGIVIGEELQIEDIRIERLSQIEAGEIPGGGVVGPGEKLLV
ncbi:MAG: hypothetical protein HYY56_04455, partial [Candidatus Omnitrophica bacterium]|nr:hypothetical protein [Candidatus Omnitrophota bacterium]